jgi:hypothetical protein
VDGKFRQLARIIDLIAWGVFFTTIGCMSAQVNREIDYQKEKNAYVPIPAEEVIVDEPVVADLKAKMSD